MTKSRVVGDPDDDGSGRNCIRMTRPPTRLIFSVLRETENGGFFGEIKKTKKKKKKEKQRTKKKTKKTNSEPSKRRVNETANDRSAMREIVETPRAEKWTMMSAVRRGGRKNCGGARRPEEDHRGNLK